MPYCDPGDLRNALRMARPNLAETFDIVRPAFSPELLSVEMAERLRTAAARLRLTSAVGFECRLAGDAPQVDLQLGMAAGEGPAELASNCESLLAALPASGRRREVWRRIHDFALEWERPRSKFQEQILHLWLEFDLPEGSLDSFIPSVFITMKRPERADQPSILEELLHSLPGGEFRPALRRALGCCRDACPAGAYISHVGMMLGRALEGFRIDIAELPLDSIAGYLKEIGWPGDGVEVQARAEELRPYCDSIVLCVSVAETIHPGVGLEAFFENPDDLNTPWERLLTNLVERGLCTAPKREALLRWTGITTPADCPAPWPEPLIVESLLLPPDRFSVFRRRLNHVKLSLSPAKPPLAKAYFGYAHEWRQGSGR